MILRSAFTLAAGLGLVGAGFLALAENAQAQQPYPAYPPHGAQQGSNPYRPVPYAAIPDDDDDIPANQLATPGAYPPPPSRGGGYVEREALPPAGHRRRITAIVRPPSPMATATEITRRSSRMADARSETASRNPMARRSRAMDLSRVTARSRVTALNRAMALSRATARGAMRRIKPRCRNSPSPISRVISRLPARGRCTLARARPAM